MRTIKFRGKRVDNGEWVYGHYAVCGSESATPNQSMILSNGGFVSYAGLIFYNVISETVGQFTGLLDKDGVEVFEGDIVTDGSNNGTVFYNNDVAQFQVDFSPIDDCSQEMCNNYNWAKVIGNIHTTTD